MSTETNTPKEADGANERPPLKTVAGELKIPFPDTYIYSNASGLGTSLMDVHISFVEVPPTGEPKVRVGIVMPIEHAAQLALGLFAQLAYFEQGFGKIRHPQWRAFFQTAQATPEEMMAEIKAQMEKATEAKDSVDDLD